MGVATWRCVWIWAALAFLARFCLGRLDHHDNTYIAFQRDTDLLGTVNAFANRTTLIPRDVTISFWARFRAQERVVFATDGEYKFSPYVFAEDMVDAFSLADQIFTTENQNNITTGWHHYMNVVDRSKDLLFFYFDGRLIAAVSLNNEFGSNPTFGGTGVSQGLIFGRFARWTDEGYLERFWPFAAIYGFMDEVSLWASALSASQVQTVFDNGVNASKPRVAAESLVICYDFEKTQGTLVKNIGSAGSDFDAVLAGYSSKMHPGVVLREWIEETENSCISRVSVTSPILVNGALRAQQTNYPPTCEPQSFEVVEGSDILFYPYGFDPNGDWVDFAITSLPSHGKLYEVNNVRPSQRIHITAVPYAPQFEHYSFMYAPAGEASTTVSMISRDIYGAVSEDATIRFYIITVDDPPTSEDVAVFTKEEQQTIVRVNVTDTDSKFVNALITKLPEHGILSYLSRSESGEIILARINSSYTSWSTTEPVSQFASSVHAVSTFWSSPPNDEYEFPYWHPYMATGEQSVDVYGDSREAWSPSQRNAPVGVWQGSDEVGLLSYGPWDSRGTWIAEGYSEFIELDFDDEVYLRKLIIGMPRGMGSVVGVKAWDNLTRAWDKIYSGRADPDFERYMQLTKQYDNFEPNPLCSTMYKTRRIRIELDTVTVADWNEIDYVMLEGVTTKQNSAIRVDNGNVEFVYTPEKDFAGVDSFKFVVCDCGDERCSDDVTALVVVENTNDAPKVPEDVVNVETLCYVGGIYVLQLPGYDPDYNDTITYTVTHIQPGPFLFSYIQGDENIPVSTVPFVAVNGTLHYEYVGNGSAKGHVQAANGIEINYIVTDSHGLESSLGRLVLQCGGVTCAAGSYYDGRKCTLCPAGRFAFQQGVRSSCDLCEPGQYQSEPGATVCVACGLTAYATSSFGASRCTCLPGSHRSGAACELCEPGYFSSEIDSDECTQCQPGFFPTDDADDNDGAGVTFGARACNPCPTNTFSADPTTALCAPCAIPRTAEPGSTTCAECDVHTYLDPFEEDYDKQCVDCVEHVHCVAGTTLETWNLAKGYWRAGPYSKEIHECPPISSCVGGVGNTGKDDSICDDNFVGRLCSLCARDYYRASTACRKCTGATNEFLVIVTTIFLVVVVFFLLFISTKPELIIELQHVANSIRRRRMSIPGFNRGVVPRSQSSFQQHDVSRDAEEGEQSDSAAAHDEAKDMPTRPENNRLKVKQVRLGTHVSDDQDASHPSAVRPLDCANQGSTHDTHEAQDVASKASRVFRRCSSKAVDAESGAFEEQGARFSRSALPRGFSRGFSRFGRNLSENFNDGFDRKRRAEAAQNSVALMRMYSMLSVKWKIIVSALQILASNSQSFLIDWPPILSLVLGIFSVLNVDIFFIPQFACVRNLNHYDRLLASTAFPIVLITGMNLFLITPLEAISQARHCRYRRKHSKLALAIIVLFFAYSSASQVIALTFVCQKFEEEGTSFLRADLSIRCGGMTYNYWFMYAVIMTFVWPLGMPSIFFCLCWRERRRIDPLQMTKKDSTVSLEAKNDQVGRAVAQRQFDPEIHAIKVLWLPYEPEFWYWESIISAQRMMLTFVASLVKPGTPVQPIFCLCVAIVFLRLQSFYNPYCHDQDDVLAEALVWMLIFFYVQALLHMLGKVDGVTMDVLLCGSIGLAIVGTIFLLLKDVNREISFIKVVRKWIKSNISSSKEESRLRGRASLTEFLRAAEESTAQIRDFAETAEVVEDESENTDGCVALGDDSSAGNEDELPRRHTFQLYEISVETADYCSCSESPPSSPTSLSPLMPLSAAP